jgi:hypothetical protein
MNFKTLTASIVALISVAAPVIANPNWKVFGRSNGGSEIALDTNSFNQSGNTVYFIYRITKNNEPFYHKGRTTDCFVGDSGQTNGHPQIWQSIDNPAEPVNVLADSPASQNMLINVCRSAVRPVKLQSGTTRETSIRKTSSDIFNRKILVSTDCRSVLRQYQNNTSVNCTKATYQISPFNPDETIIYFLDEIHNTGIWYRVKNTPEDGSDIIHYPLIEYKIINNAIPSSSFDFHSGSCFVDNDNNRLTCVAGENSNVDDGKVVFSSSN